jgi:hypothetical protein
MANLSPLSLPSLAGQSGHPPEDVNDDGGMYGHGDADPDSVPHPRRAGGRSDLVQAHPPSGRKSPRLVHRPGLYSRRTAAGPMWPSAFTRGQINRDQAEPQVQEAGQGQRRQIDRPDAQRVDPEGGGGCQGLPATVRLTYCRKQSPVCSSH